MGRCESAVWDRRCQAVLDSRSTVMDVFFDDRADFRDVAIAIKYWYDMDEEK